MSEIYAERLIDAPMHRIRLAINSACHHPLGRIHVKRYSWGGYDIRHTVGPSHHTYRLVRVGPYVAVQLWAARGWPGLPQLDSLLGRDALRASLRDRLAKVAHYCEILPRGGVHPDPVHEIE